MLSSIVYYTIWRFSFLGTTDRSSGLSSVVELAIAVVCTFVVTLLVLGTVFVCILFICVRKRSDHSDTKLKKNNSYSSPHELKNW